MCLCFNIPYISYDIYNSLCFTERAEWVGNAVEASIAQLESALKDKKLGTHFMFLIDGL